MSKKQILGIIMSLAVLCLVLSSLLIRAQYPLLVNPDFVDALWIAKSDGISKIATTDATILLQIADVRNVRAVAVDEQRGVLWAYTQNMLWAYHFNGEPSISIPLIPHSLNFNHKDAALSVNPNNGTVWLGVKKFLYHFGPQGAWLSAHTLSEHIRALSWDPTTSCVWVGTETTVNALNDTGSLCKVIDLGPHPDVQDLAADPSSGDLWVAMKKGVQRYDASGTLMFEIDIDKLAHLVSDYQGGVWIASNKRLIRMDRTGLMLLEIEPFTSREKIVGLIADPTDSSVWVASKETISHISSDGHLVHELALKGGIRDLALYTDRIPPGLTFTAPRDGITLKTNTPTLGIQYHDSGSGVDLETLFLLANDAHLPAICQYGAIGATCTPTTGLLEGVVTLTATIRDYAGNTSEEAETRITVDTTPPVITLTSPVDGTFTNQALQSFVGSLSELATLTLNGEEVRVESNQSFSHGPVSLHEGLNTFELIATDAVGNSSHLNARVTLDTVPPAAVDKALIEVGDVSDGQVRISGQAGSVESASGVTITNTRTGQTVTVGPHSDGSFASTIAAQNGDVLSIVTIDAAGNASEPSTVEVGSVPPPDPSSVAPPLNRTVVTDFATATAFLYSGSRPIQTGVVADTIEPRRVAVLRGQVRTRDGANLAGVTITILGHPEYGQTLSRGDGLFDLAVNGGGLLTVRYEKGGYLPVQRQVQVPWRDYAWLPDVVMLPYDEQVTTIDLTMATGMQVARGSVMTDERGTRQATLLFAPGTEAMMILPDGTTQPLTNLRVRATEYTVGPDGPTAMPAQLPPTSAYTYAVELSVDEAMAAGATTVQFNQPVYVYVQNFLDFPVGGAVPAGYYDRSKGVWVASDNGRIIKVISIVEGMAEIDINGDAIPDDATTLVSLGITEAERQHLATFYQPGQSLWRVPVTHFTPLDFNWPSGPSPGARHPNQPEPRRDKPLDEPTCRGGSIIECENQVLGEIVAIIGTPFALHYRSDRVPGRKAARSLEIQLSGAQIPPSLIRIELEVYVAGRRFTQTFPATANQTYHFSWDGRDSYGRSVQGSQPVTARIGYVYYAIYQMPAVSTGSFGLSSGIPLPGNRFAMEIIYWQEHRSRLGTWEAQGQGLGGWTLGPHHFYDPSTKILFPGNGGRRSAYNAAGIITTVAGNGWDGVEGDGIPAVSAQLSIPIGVAVDGQESLYIAELGYDRIRKVSPDGIISTIAGIGITGYSGDGGPATSAQLHAPRAVTVDSYGNLFIAESQLLFDGNGHRVRKVSSDGIITTVAGTGVRGYSGDGGPATSAQLALEGEGGEITVDKHRNLFIADAGNNRVRKVSPDGLISTVAGNGQADSYGDGGSAANAALSGPTGVAVDGQGNLFITEGFGSRVRKVSPDGIITTVAGNGTFGDSGDGGLATNAQLDYPTAVAVDGWGTLFIAEAYRNRVRKVSSDGIITTVAGTGRYGYSGDGGPPAAAQLGGPATIALDAEGNLYIADTGNGRIRKVTPSLPGFVASTVLIPATDGQEAYEFDGQGRHHRTLDALTGALRYQFSYNNAGELSQIADGDGMVTVIERNAAGHPTAIIAPFGQRTILTLDEHGYLASLTNPANETTRLTYTVDSLLTSLTTPNGHTSRFSYDLFGRLIRDEDPAGGFKALARTDSDTTSTVSLINALGRTSTYQVLQLPTGGMRRVNTDPRGLQSITEVGTDGGRRLTAPNGTVTTMLEGPDPRFGMQAPLIQLLAITTPGGLTATVTETRTVTLPNPLDLLSLTHLTDTVTVNGRLYTSTYEAASRTITNRTPMGRQMVSTIDGLGRVVEQGLAGLEPLRFAYNTAGQLAAVTQGSRHTLFTYDVQGRLATITDPLSRTVGFGYDAVGRVNRRVLPDGREVLSSYDANGNITSLTPPGRPSHAFTYTPIDLEDSYIPPAVGVEPSSTYFTYNLDHQLIRMTRPDGISVDLGYDGAGRPSTLMVPRGQLAFSYHPTTGTLAAITDPDGGTLSYDYDGGLLTRETWAGTISGIIQYTHDDNFRLTSQSVNGESSLTFQYDADSLLTQVGALVISRDSQNGHITGSTLGSIVDARAYNSFGELSSYKATFTGSDIFAAQYTRDPLGRIIQKTETVEGQSNSYRYTYDFAGRLTEVQRNGSTVATYAYDGNGNRLSHTNPNGTLTGAYNVQDRLLQYGSTAYTYTANGELQRKTTGSQTTTYEYDALGNLRAVTLPDGSQIEYVIDGRNRRIGKKVNGVLVQGFLYDGDLAPVAALDGSGQVTARFIYGTRGYVPDYMVKGGITYRLITDHLGSPRIVIDTTTGHIVQRMHYDAFGQVTFDDNPGFQPFGFAGGLYDPDTKLTRFGARDYDAETGRWTAKDPIRFLGGDANLYGYAFNDPVNFIDPNGKIVPALLAAGAALWAAVEASMSAFDFLDMLRTLADPCAGGWSKAASAGGFLVGMAAPGGGYGSAARGGTEVVQRAMSRAELKAIEKSGVLSRGGRSGPHYVSDAVNSDAFRARERLALPQTPEVRVTMEVPSGAFSSPSKVAANFGMPGGGIERTAPGHLDIPVRILGVLEY